LVQEEKYQEILVKREEIILNYLNLIYLGLFAFSYDHTYAVYRKLFN
jgi:hypothetical protein